MTSTTTSSHAKNDAPSRSQDISPEATLSVGWKVAVLVLAAAPFLHTLATWDPDGQIKTFNHALRLYSLPIAGLELVILLWAALLGWRPVQHFLILPKMVKWLCAGFVVSVTITTLFASNSAMTSALFLLRYLLHICLASNVIFLVSRDPRFDFNHWTSLLSWGALAYLTALTIFCLLVADPQNFRWVERIPSATNIRQIGNVFALLALAPVATLLFAQSLQLRIAMLLLNTALITFIAWSGTRGALLGLGAAFCIALWRERCSTHLSRVVLLICSCMIGLAASLLIPNPAPEFGLIRIAESVGTGDSSSGRWEAWQGTVEAIQHAPVLGYGAGTYRENMAVLNGYPYNHPHNFILQFVYDWGFAGGGLALILLAWLGCSLFGSNKGSVEERFLATGGFVALVTMALVEGTLFHPLPMIISIALIAPWMARRRA